MSSLSDNNIPAVGQMTRYLFASFGRRYWMHVTGENQDRDF